MNDLPLNALRAFAAIYSSGGVRPAARHLGIAHSSVSRHLVELESWLEVSLTYKGGAGRRKLVFTEQGAALGEATLESLQALEAAVASVREARSESSVQIGTHPSIAVRWLLPRLPALETSYPNLEVSVIVDGKLGDTERADLDLVITMGRKAGPEAHWQRLMGDALYPVMSPDFWARHARPAKPKDLVGLRLLHDRDPDASWSEWRSAHGPENLDVQTGPRFTSTDLVLRAAAAGQGVALARHQLALEDLASGRLIRPLGDLEVELQDAYWIVCPRHKLPKPAALGVIEWLKRETTMRGTE